MLLTLGTAFGVAVDPARWISPRSVLVVLNGPERIIVALALVGVIVWRYRAPDTGRCMVILTGAMLRIYESLSADSPLATGLYIAIGVCGIGYLADEYDIGTRFLTYLLLDILNRPARRPPTERGDA